MKSNNEIVEELMATRFVPNYIRQRACGWPHKDLEQDVYLILLEYPLLQKIYKEKGINGVRQVTSGIIQRHLSEKGKGFRLYKRERIWTDNKIPEISYEQDTNFQL